MHIAKTIIYNIYIYICIQVMVNYRRVFLKMPVVRVTRIQAVTGVDDITFTLLNSIEEMQEI